MRSGNLEPTAFNNTPGLDRAFCPVRAGRFCWDEVGGDLDVGDEPMLRNTLKKLILDEQGGEVLEYALIAGLIVVAAIAVITSVGAKVVARWTSLNSSM